MKQEDKIKFMEKKFICKRPKIGDIVEIETPKGFTYFQYVRKGPDYHETPLIRILPGLYKKRPDNFTDIAKQKERFWIYYPLGASCWREITFIVANEEIPKHAQTIPLMRASGMRDRDGKVQDWWLRDGKKEWCIDRKLTHEEKKLSPSAIWNDTLLIERISSNWKPEDEI